MASSLTEPKVAGTGTGPRIVPPKPTKPGSPGSGNSLGLNPSIHYTLSDIDVLVGPHTFAAYAGYTSFEDFLADNPDLLFVQPESSSDWPPDAPFLYWISGSKDVVTFSPTYRLEPNYRIPTYTRMDETGEWMFPFWNTSLVHAEGSTIKGPAPISVTAPSVPVVESTYALLPWTVGTVVTVRQEPIYL